MTNENIKQFTLFVENPALFYYLLALLYFFSYLGQGQGGFIYNEF